MKKELIDPVRSRLRKKPEYKLGDLIIYYDSSASFGEKEDIRIIRQGIIIESLAVINIDDKLDTLTWSYNTKETIDKNSLLSSDIICKL